MIGAMKAGRPPRAPEHTDGSKDRMQSPVEPGVGGRSSIAVKQSKKTAAATSRFQADSLQLPPTSSDPGPVGNLQHDWGKDLMEQQNLTVAEAAAYSQQACAAITAIHAPETGLARGCADQVLQAVPVQLQQIVDLLQSIDQKLEILADEKVRRQSASWLPI